MSTKRNKKLCTHCEGEIDRDALYCLYCGAEVSQVAEPEVPAPPYQAEKPKEQVAPLPVENKTILPLMPFTMLLVGAYFGIFGLFLLFFSEDGMLTLQWDASFWFVYFLLSVPLLLIGFKKLK